MGFERVALGRTGLSVTRLGVAASYGTDEAMVEAAVERGVNYLWWGALRTRKMARGIRAVARKNRDDLVIVLHVISHKLSDSLLLEVFTNEGNGTLVVGNIDTLSPEEQSSGATS